MAEISTRLQERVFGRRLRANSLAKATQVLTAADSLLRANPYATLEEIGVAAGVSRTTLYRRFPTRQDLSTALSRWAVGRIVEALEAAQIDVAPAYVALYQAVRNVIEVKVSLEYARTLALPDDHVVREYRDDMQRMATQLLMQCQDEGIVRTNIDLDWARVMFYALVHEAIAFETATGFAPDQEKLTRLVVDSLLNGVGTGKI